ncbi:hypothetical protein BJF78_31215 [Pseudonocardia sp. CNS-139]|nr:hypothetical protein BJF78_31215 [Pseudonocardia sp. CNS-139]
MTMRPVDSMHPRRNRFRPLPSWGRPSRATVRLSVSSPTTPRRAGSLRARPVNRPTSQAVPSSAIGPSSTATMASARSMPRPSTA